jgi:glycosyltransferase involved in cell wall biosynthesis
MSDAARSKRYEAPCILSSPTSMSRISLVYKSELNSCGIRIFNQRLAAALTERGHSVNECNVAIRSYVPETITIIHYAPSMWTKDGGELNEIIRRAARGRLIVILHAMYRPFEDTLFRDIPCPELERHVHAIASKANAIVALSHSCLSAWRRWKNVESSPKTAVFVHPGAEPFGFPQCPERPYVFFGGILRPKKDPRSDRMLSLFSAYRKSGLNVWIHGTNCTNAAQLDDLPVWRTTAGVLPDENWFGILANASAVLCPYETKIQCVSGVIAEAISVGTRAFSTRFPFAREMSHRYPEYVTLEDELEKWPSLTTPLRRYHPRRPQFPTWSEFADSVLGALSPRHQMSVATPLPERVDRNSETDRARSFTSE